MRLCISCHNEFFIILLYLNNQWISKLSDYQLTSILVKNMNFLYYTIKFTVCILYPLKSTNNESNIFYSRRQCNVYREKCNILILGITDNPAASIDRIYIDAANNQKLINIVRGFGYRRSRERAATYSKIFIG